MGYKVSKQTNVVLLCRQRKEQLKVAVDRRYVFADAHCKYNQSLNAVAVSIRSFVESHTFQYDSDSLPTKNINDYSSSDSLKESLDDREEVKENSDHNAGTDGEELGLSLPNDEAVREGRELFEALKEVEVQFHKAYNSSLEVSKMVGTNMDKMQYALEETEEKSSKLKKSRSISSTLSSFSSQRSLFRSSTRSSSTSTHFNGGLFADNGAMGSKCHSLTLRTLYAWEQKLYEEVKAGEEIRRLYDRKWSQYSRNQGHDPKIVDKIGVEVEELLSRILVAKGNAETILNNIRTRRDEELQPQLIELLQGLMKNWKIMSETHETQHRIMSEVKYVNCSSYGKLCKDSHQLATRKFEAELQNWSACFASYVSSQKEYIEALDGWLHELVAPESEVDSDMWSSLWLCRVGMLPSREICDNWLDSINKLPHKAVPCAMKFFGKDVQALMVRQGKDHQQKRKVDGLAKKLHWQASTFDLNRRIMGLKLSDEKKWLRLKKMENKVREFKETLNKAKVQHHKSMKETQNLTVNKFKTGFSLVFKSLTEFSKSVVEMYDGLSENAMKIDDQNSKPPRIHVEADDQSSQPPRISVGGDNKSSQPPRVDAEGDNRKKKCIKDIKKCINDRNTMHKGVLES